MKIFFVTNAVSDLADEQSSVMEKARQSLLKIRGVQETKDPDNADAIIIQEKNSYKNFRYIEHLLNDPLISKYAHKVITINDDDCATGLLRGLYTSLPKYRFNPAIHVATPYMQYPNEQVFSGIGNVIKPCYLASWRGNTKSNMLRKRMISMLAFKTEMLIEKTDSWLNHGNSEKSAYVSVIKNAKFSLCPAGWAPVSFRIYESMALGRCPVIIADNFVPPTGPVWKEFAIFFPEKNLSVLGFYLREMEVNHVELGEKAKKAWEVYFSPEKIGDYYANALLSLIDGVTSNTLEKEIQRWRSLRVYWSNKWTVPQRIMNKARQMLLKQQA